MTECRLSVLGGGSLRKKRVCVLTSLDVNFSPLDLWDVVPPGVIPLMVTTDVSFLSAPCTYQ